MESTNKLTDDAASKTDGEIACRGQGQPLSDSSTSEIFNTLENPLLNPLIVDLVVKHLHPNFEQLKTLRLVSKVWSEATLHHWRNSSAVLTLVPDNPSCFTKSIYKKGLPVSQFLTEFQDPQSPFQLSQKPFSSYKLTELILDLEVCNEPDTLAFRFWSTIGPLMESVHFYKCSFVRPGNDFSTTSCPSAQFLVEMIPNLKDVVITDKTPVKAQQINDDDFSDEDFSDEDFSDEYDSSDDGYEEVEAFENEPHLNLRTLTICGDLRRNQGLNELLQMAPGLEVIKGCDQSWRPLLAPIYAVRNHSESIPKALSNLKEVDLMNSLALKYAHFPIPSEIGLQVPLETLSLHLAFDDLSIADEKVNIYLKSFSSTLKTFKGFRVPADGPYSNFLFNVTMGALTELHLEGIIAPHLGFLKSTPNLKKLLIDLGCFEKREKVQDIIWDVDFHNNYGYTKYQEDMVLKVPKAMRQGILCSDLEYLEIDQELTEKSLRILGKWVPNLKTLKTILNGGTVPIVCGNWGELTELVCLYGSKIGNSWFIRDEKQAGFSGGPPSKLKICDLFDLERFQLDAYCDECELTDDVVFQGFLKMPGLKCVEICVDSKMSVEAEEALKKGIQFCKVDRDGHDKCCGSSEPASSSFRCDRCTFREETFIEEIIISDGSDEEENEDLGRGKERHKELEDQKPVAEDASSGSI